MRERWQCTATSQPWRARARAMTRPTRRPAPVTRAMRRCVADSAVDSAVDWMGVCAIVYNSPMSKTVSLPLPNEAAQAQSAQLFAVIADAIAAAGGWLPFDRY
ncbi:class I SAM-dependent methyltransferase, partial [Ralstonia sp. Ralssp135]